ncbi:(2Fe-2S)-binding protein [Nonomuraea candida]|uniref:(2Fe-2S)-binding protein n=1 Tax=Nonomuraea candida TaxID=359159 RepID=UPI001B80DA04|nr:2Fe-2S iron-sulfur cluster-binding protein [Nonomuraea candida]
MKVNGDVEALDVEPRVSLLDALRERLGLMGPKKGCDQGACGACTVLADGMRINSCLALAVQYDGSEITTIEGVTHPLQEAFVRHDGFQCGYCTSGQICSAIGMLAEHEAGMPSAVADASPLTEAEVRERMSGNLCRCGAYNGIVDAIMDVAGKDGR